MQKIIEGKIDASTNVLSANNKYYELVGENLYYAFRRNIAEEFQERFLKMMDDARKNKTASDMIKLVFSEEEEYYIRLTYNSQEDGYDFVMWSIAGVNEQIQSQKHQIQYMRDILSVEGDIYFKYNYKDSGFILYYVANGQSIVRFKGTFEEWVDKVWEKEYISEEEGDIFRAFIKDVYNKSRNINYRLNTKIATNGDRTDMNHIMASYARDGEKEYVAGVISIISGSTCEKTDSFLNESYVDPLSGVLNKKAINEYAKRAIEDAGENHVAFVITDIDNFKDVNDNFGHMFGDEVIKAFAGVLRDAVAGKGTCGRFGGDEFFMVIDKVEDELELRNILRTIKANTHTLYQGKLGENNLTCSIGASRYKVNSNDFKELFQIADRALYMAKQKGKDRYIIYTEEKHGVFQMQPESEQIDMATNRFAEEDVDRVGRCFVNLVEEGHIDVNRYLSYLLEVYNMDRANVYVGKPLQKVYGTSKECYDIQSVGVMEALEEAKMFDENGSFCVSNVNELEYKVPKVYGMLKSEDVYACYIYRNTLKDGRKVYIQIDKCGASYTWPKGYISELLVGSRVISAILDK